MASFRISSDEVVGLRALVNMLSDRVEGLERLAKKRSKRRRKPKSSGTKKGSKGS